jgi:hypothetical protein
MLGHGLLGGEKKRSPFSRPIYLKQECRNVQVHRKVQTNNVNIYGRLARYLDNKRTNSHQLRAYDRVIIESSKFVTINSLVVSLFG